MQAESLSLSLSLSLFNRKRKQSLLREERGSISIVLALLLVPLITLTLAAVLTTRHLSVWTRTHQAQTAAVLAVAKEGEDVAGSDRFRMVETWLNENLSVIRSGDLWIPSLSGTQDTEQLAVTWTPSTLLDGFMNNLFQNPVYDTVHAERFYRPIEAVVVLDASSSQSKNKNMMIELTEKVADKLFRGNTAASDVRMGVISYSNHINIGIEYADKLVTPESRKLAKPGTTLGGTKTQEMYDAQVETLNEYNGGLVDDLLASGGPASHVGMVCVARPEAPSGANASAYMETIKFPPSDPTKGFTLLMGDGRMIKEGTTTVAGLNPPMAVTNYLANAQVGDKQFNNEDILNLALLPHEYVVDSERREYARYSQWGGGWDNFKDRVVTYYYDCPAMPMLVGARDTGEVMEHMEMFNGVWTTGTEEGLAWALRMLNPNWGDIWDKGGSYPAAYHSGTEKRILIVSGYNNQGYGGIQGKPDAITPMCEYAKENGIDIYVVLAGENFMFSYLLIPLYEKNGVNVVNLKTNEEVIEGMTQFAQRHYRVRLSG